MEEKLVTINEQFKIETETATEVIQERIKVLNHYLSTLHECSEEISKLRNQHKTDIETVISEKAYLESEHKRIREEHQVVVLNHENKVKELDNQIAQKTKALETLQNRESNLNKTIDGLMVEYRSIEARLSNLQGSLSATERRVRDLQNEELRLTASIEEKNKENAEQTIQNGHLKVEFARLTNDVAILEARKK